MGPCCLCHLAQASFGSGTHAPDCEAPPWPPRSLRLLRQGCHGHGRASFGARPCPCCCRRCCARPGPGLAEAGRERRRRQQQHQQPPRGDCARQVPGPTTRRRVRGPLLRPEGRPLRPRLRQRGEVRPDVRDHGRDRRALGEEGAVSGGGGSGQQRRGLARSSLQPSAAPCRCCARRRSRGGGRGGHPGRP